MSVRTVPLINARWSQSKLSLWTWRAGVLGLALALIGVGASMLVWISVEIADVLFHATSHLRR